MDFLSRASSSSMQSPARPATKRTASMVSLPTPPGTEDLTFLHGAREGQQYAGPSKDKRSRTEPVPRGMDDEEDPFADSRPLATAQRPAKRTRVAAADSSDEDEGGQAQSTMDSPNNPFKAKRGEKVQRTPSTNDDRDSNKITYVFRGKRIHYDAPDDMVLPGDSPFAGGIKPRLLFPSPSTPPPKLAFASSSTSAPGFGIVTPGRDSDLIMRTPVKPREHDTGRPRCPLPTPQSRPRPARQ